MKRNGAFTSTFKSTLGICAYVHFLYRQQCRRHGEHDSGCARGAIAGSFKLSLASEVTYFPTTTLAHTPESCLKDRSVKVNQPSELDSNHELQLPRQPGTGVRRCCIIVIEVEIHGCIDVAEAGFRGQHARRLHLVGVS